MRKSLNTTAKVLAGLLTLSFVLSWWDYARTEPDSRRLFLGANKLIIQIDQVKGNPSNPSQ
jgi:hypothetical protein